MKANRTHRRPRTSVHEVNKNFIISSWINIKILSVSVFSNITHRIQSHFTWFLMHLRTCYKKIKFSVAAIPRGYRTGTITYLHVELLRYTSSHTSSTVAEWKTLHYTNIITLLVKIRKDAKKNKRGLKFSKEMSSKVQNTTCSPYPKGPNHVNVNSGLLACLKF